MRFNTVVLSFLMVVYFVCCFMNLCKANTNKFKIDTTRGMQYVVQFPVEVFVNFYKQGIAPFKANKQQWLIGTAVTAASFALIPADPNIDEVVKPLKNKHSFIDKASPIITEGGGNYIIVPVAVFALAGVLNKKPKMVETGLMALEAAIHAGVWIRVGKTVSGRERPSAAYNSGVIGGYWCGPRLKNIWGGASVDAFPSGHTGTAFSIATVFAKQYNETPWIPIIAYSTATLVGITRLTEHTHWASDVLLGGAVGYACARQVWKSHQSPSKLFNKYFSNVELNPLIGKQSYAMSARLSF
jgi:membrane-associated phospholipid phosphatase